MSHAAVSMYATSLYAFVLSVIFFTIPDVALSVFGLPPHKDVFLYIAAMLVLFISSFYFMAARTEARAIFKWTVALRLSIPFFLAAFVATGQSTINLMLFAPPDVLLALWTILALRSDARSTAKLVAIGAGTIAR